MGISERKIPAHFENMVFYDNKIWFTEIRINELYYYDLQTNETKIFCKIDSEDCYDERLFGGIVHYNGYLYLIPARAKKIYKIRISDKEMSEISIKIPDSCLNDINDNDLKFSSVHLYNGKIYIFGIGYPAIIEMDCEKDELVYYSEWVYMLKGFALEDGKALFRKTLLEKQKVYAPFARGNAVLIFDLETKEIQIKNVGSEKCVYSSICYDGKEFWLAPRHDGPVVRWNSESGSWQEFEDFPTECVHKTASFGDIVCYNANILLLPLNANMIVNINPQNGRMQKYEGLGRVCKCESEKVQYFYSIQTHMLYIIENDIINKREIFLPKETVEKHAKIFSHTNSYLAKGVACNGVVLQEDYEEALFDFLKFLRNS